MQKSFLPQITWHQKESQVILKLHVSKVVQENLSINFTKPDLVEISIKTDDGKNYDFNLNTFANYSIKESSYKLFKTEI